MNLQLGTGQEVNIHNVKSVAVDKIEYLNKHGNQKRFYKTMTIKTKSGESIEITLFSDKKSVLKYQ